MTVTTTSTVLGYFEIWTTNPHSNSKQNLRKTSIPSIKQTKSQLDKCLQQTEAKEGGRKRQTLIRQSIHEEWSLIFRKEVAKRHTECRTV